MSILNWDEVFAAIDIDSPRYDHNAEPITLEFTTSSARPCNFKHVYHAATRHESFDMLFAAGVRRGLALHSTLN
jgi:hypothetical protein